VLLAGIDGFTVRGRVPETTNTRMELIAAVEGLRNVPAGAPVVLHSDATAIVSVYQEMLRNDARKQGVDRDLWDRLRAQFARVDARVDLLGRGPRPYPHRLAHVIAGSEARAGLRGLPVGAVPIEDMRKIRDLDRARLAREANAREYLVHEPPARGVYASRRSSEARRLV
jgi:hypothetical protein